MLCSRFDSTSMKASGSCDGGVETVTWVVCDDVEDEAEVEVEVAVVVMVAVEEAEDRALPGLCRREGAMILEQPVYYCY